MRSRTGLLRENLEGTPQQLILSYVYLHKPVNSQTIARCVKLFLGRTGITISVFTAHSTRSASTSTANNMGLSIRDYKKTVGGSGDSTFPKYYNLLIEKFCSEILNRFPDKWKTVELSCLTISVLFCIVYIFAWKRISVDQYCVLQKINFWLPNLIWILTVGTIIIFQNYYFPKKTNKIQLNWKNKYISIHVLSRLQSFFSPQEKIFL